MTTTEDLLGLLDQALPYLRGPRHSDWRAHGIDPEVVDRLMDRIAAALSAAPGDEAVAHHPQCPCPGCRPVPAAPAEPDDELAQEALDDIRALGITDAELMSALATPAEPGATEVERPGPPVDDLSTLESVLALMTDWVAGRRSWTNLGPDAPYTPDVIAAMDAAEVEKLRHLHAAIAAPPAPAPVMVDDGEVSVTPEGAGWRLTVQIDPEGNAVSHLLSDADAATLAAALSPAPADEGRAIQIGDLFPPEGHRYYDADRIARLRAPLVAGTLAGTTAQDVLELLCDWLNMDKDLAAAPPASAVPEERDEGCLWPPDEYAERLKMARRRSDERATQRQEHRATPQVGHPPHGRRHVAGSPEPLDDLSSADVLASMMRTALDRSGLKQFELAERLGITSGEVSRRINDPSDLRWSTLTRTLAALGFRVEMVHATGEGDLT